MLMDIGNASDLEDLSEDLSLNISLKIHCVWSRKSGVSSTKC